MGAQRGAAGEITIAGRETPAGLTLVTRGLAARGLPEITVTGLPPYLGRGWARLLAALAFRLAAHAGDVPDRIALTPDDLRTALGEPVSAGCSQITVGLARHGDLLTPAPPPDYTGPRERWHTDLVTEVFPAARR
ncbi:hypothetical protein SAMN04489712_105151 [Thermomonospora echinospora]|uniref:Uncharacterized protein n=1 Tax=Thermomonospora echinospora TaxID=1992 RepID=A0A1H6A1N8_9ACTN|nr:hypothetical protein [Thermomonospora echinospora]SEG42649.1 hypothetical protein SAMN04489712_105151 [Thermomonospora echinospora]